MLTRWLAPLLIATSALDAAAQDANKPVFASPKLAPTAAETKPADPQAAPPVPEIALSDEEQDADEPVKKLALPKPPTVKTRAFFGAGTTPQTITLSQALRQALNNNLEARVEEAGISLEDARVRNAYGVYDPIFSFSIIRSQTRTPDSRQNISSADAVAQIQSIQAQIDSINANTTANQQFTNAILQALGRPTQVFNTTPLTADFTGNQRIIFDNQSDRGQIALQLRSPIGTVIQASAGVTKIRTTFEGDTRNITPTYLASGSIEFRQPLLKDFGFAANLADLRIARKNRQAQEFAWRFTLESQLQKVVSSYFDMLFGLNDLTNKADAITGGLQLVAFTVRRKELGFLSDYEVQQAQVQLALDQGNLLLSKTNFLRFQFSLKRLVLPGYDAADLRIFLPEQMPSLKVPKLDRDELLALAFANRSDYKAALLAAEAEEVRLKFARNQCYPQLDVVGSYGWNGLDSSYPSAVGKAQEGQADSWSIGVSGQIPLGNVQPRAQLYAAKARKEQAILRVSQSERDVGLSIEQAIQLIRTNQEGLETARFTTRAATQAVKTGLRRLEEGLISNFDLIRQQRDLYDARTRELSATAELNKSITELWFATGTVLENLNISMPAARPVTTGIPKARPVGEMEPPPELEGKKKRGRS